MIADKIKNARTILYYIRQKVARDMFQCLMRWWLVSREYLRTGSIPKFLPKLMTKICKDMPKYARISE